MIFIKYEYMPLAKYDLCASQANTHRSIICFLVYI